MSDTIDSNLCLRGHSKSTFTMAAMTQGDVEDHVDPVTKTSPRLQAHETYREIIRKAQEMNQVDAVVRLVCRPRLGV
jgi:hypothetical protein